MKLEEQRKAQKLRKAGHSIGAIASQLRVSKGSVSRWVADIELTAVQIKKLKINPHTAVAVEKRRRVRLKNENEKRAMVTNTAINEIRSLTDSELFFLGVALYWGEGTKKKRGVVEFTNCDAKAIQVMLLFFRRICGVPEEKLRGHVYLHEHLSIANAERYWSDVAYIPLTQFYKTSIQHNRKRPVKDTQQYGTFAVSVCDTQLKLKILGWIEGTYRVVTNNKV